MKTKMLLLALALVAVPATALRADLIDNLTVEIRLGHRATPCLLRVHAAGLLGLCPWTCRTHT